MPDAHRCVGSILFAFSVISGSFADPPPPSFKQPIDYLSWLNERFGKDVGPEGAAHLMNAADANVGADSALDLAKRNPLTWSDADRKQLEHWIETYDAALTELIEGAAARQVYLPWASPSGHLVDAEQVYLGRLRGAILALRARAWLSALAGKADGALDDLAAILRVSRHLQSQPMIIDHLVGIAAAHPAYETLMAWATLPGRQADYEKILKRLATADESQPSLGNALAGEQAFVLDMLQRWGKDADADGRIEALETPFGLGEQDPARANQDPSKPKRYDIKPPIELAAAAKIVGECMDLAARLETLRYPQVQAALEEFRAANRKLGKLAALTFDAERTDQLRRARDGAQNATRAILRILAFRKTNGRCPVSLREAMKEDAATLRWDPFSRGDLIYKIKSNDFELYSVGLNQKDDGGKRGQRSTDPQSDIVYWPPADK